MKTPTVVLAAIVASACVAPALAQDAAMHPQDRDARVVTQQAEADARTSEGARHAAEDAAMNNTAAADALDDDRQVQDDSAAMEEVPQFLVEEEEEDPA